MIYKKTVEKPKAAPKAGEDPIVMGQHLKSGRHGGHCSQLERNRRQKKHKAREKRMAPLRAQARRDAKKQWKEGKPPANWSPAPTRRSWNW